jgi:hypothetical protein
LEDSDQPESCIAESLTPSRSPSRECHSSTGPVTGQGPGSRRRFTDSARRGPAAGRRAPPPGRRGAAAPSLAWSLVGRMPPPSLRHRTGTVRIQTRCVFKFCRVCFWLHEFSIQSELLCPKAAMPSAPLCTVLLLSLSTACFGFGIGRLVFLMNLSCDIACY